MICLKRERRTVAPQKNSAKRAKKQCLHGKGFSGRGELMKYLSEKEKEKILGIKEGMKKILSGKRFRMILFGSKARGDFEPFSDIDLAFIIDDFSAELKKSILDLVIQIECDDFVSGISPLIFSSEKFELLKNRERRLALDIEKEGIPL